MDAKYWRERHGYTDDPFQIVLACPYDESEREMINGKIALYDSMSELVDKMGKRIFLPHRDLGEDWDDRKTRDIMDGVLISEADIIIADTGYQSLDVDGICGRALALGTPYICMHCEKDEVDDDRYHVNDSPGEHGNGGARGCVIYKDPRDALTQLETSLRKFYKMK